MGHIFFLVKDAFETIAEVFGKWKGRMAGAIRIFPVGLFLKFNHLHAPFTVSASLAERQHNNQGLEMEAVGRLAIHKYR